MNIIDGVTWYESGELTEQETIEFFAQLIKKGIAWQLQGSYGRQAMRFIEAGILDREGNIL